MICQVSHSLIVDTKGTQQKKSPSSKTGTFVLLPALNVCKGRHMPHVSQKRIIVTMHYCQKENSCDTSTSQISGKKTQHGHGENEASELTIMYQIHSANNNLNL